MRQYTLRHHLAIALDTFELPSLTWYQATRHTFTSQWVLSGGSLEKSAIVMGHSSVVVTERYAHLLPDLLRDENHQLLDVDLQPAKGILPVVTELTEKGACSYVEATQAASGAASAEVTN